MTLTLLPHPPKSFISQHAGIHPVVLSLLWQRSVRTAKEIENFLNPVYGDKKFNPFQFKEMKLVVERILKAADKKEKVLVYGDYDADGVCSSVLLIETLEKLYGIKSERRESETNEQLISVYLPHREEEGYGLTMRSVDYIKNRGTQLVITCDCGTGNIAELLALRAIGIDVIVLDHHLAPLKRPPAYGFINPKFEKESYPFCELAGCGVVFKVVQGIRDYLQTTPLDGVLKKHSHQLLGEGFEKWSLDLVALATIADMMPLRSENRVFVKWGLHVMKKMRRPGIRALAESAKLTRAISTYDISFILAPRINAAGRLDHANVAFDLLRETNYANALKYASALAKTNERRQKITEKIFQEAVSQVQKQYYNNDKILVAHNLKKNEWQTGILGLVAGKLVKEYGRPAFVIGKSAHGLAGSGRSIKNFDITALIKSASHLFENFGGHPQACGFTFIESTGKKKLINEFKQISEAYADKCLRDQDLSQTITVDIELSFSAISWGLIKSLETLEPYGQENSKPVFLTRAVSVESARVVGSNGDHSKLTLSHSGATHHAICFRCSDHIKKIQPGRVCDVVYTIELNEWRGEKTIQLMVREILL